MSVNSLKDFISENAGQISIKFHVQLQGEDGGGEGLVFFNGPGLITKMAAMSIYGINLKRSRSFSPVPQG